MKRFLALLNASNAWICSATVRYHGRDVVISNWIFIFVVPAAASIWGVWYTAVYGVSFADFSLFIFMIFLTGFSITAGYHRLFTHRSYECHAWVRILFLSFGACAMEMSALRWCYLHRLHHRFTDRDGDPYSVEDGFWWAHIVWIMYSVPPKTLDGYEGVADLRADPLILWQHRYYLWICWVSSFGICILFGWFTGRMGGAILWGTALRISFVYHMTFSVNSLAHWWGTQPFWKSGTSRDNTLLAFFTLGESYHNYHHTHPSDYRNGVDPRAIDATKWLIAGLARLGLAWNLRRARRPKTA